MDSNNDPCIGELLTKIAEILSRLEAINQGIFQKVGRKVEIPYAFFEKIILNVFQKKNRGGLAGVLFLGSIRNDVNRKTKELPFLLREDKTIFTKSRKSSLVIPANETNKANLGLALRVAFFCEWMNSSQISDPEKINNDIRGLIKKNRAGENIQDKNEENKYWLELLEKSSGFLGHWEKLTGVKWGKAYPSWRDGLLKIIGSFEGEFWEIDESLLSAPEFKGTDVLDFLFEGTGVKPVYGNREMHKGQVFQVIDEGYLRQLASRNLEPRWENHLVNTAGAKVIHEVVLPGLFQSKENRQSVYWSYFSDTQLIVKKVAV